MDYRKKGFVVLGIIQNKYLKVEADNMGFIN